MKKTTSGFTVVEVLIVIVAIGILAAVIVVAYGGVQSRMIEASAQSDLATFSKKIGSFQEEHGRYPKDATELATHIRMPFIHSAYIQTDGNFVYCASKNGTAWMLLVKATNAKNYYIGSDRSVLQYTGPAGTPTVMCNATGFATATSVWGYEPTGWGNPGYRSWTTI